MRRSRSFIVALGAICAFSLAGGSSSAAEMHEGVVSVSGRGEAIRVVVYAGFSRVRGRRALSCDDGERKIVDRMMEAGATVSFVSPEACVCFQRSASAFRRVDLTQPEWACAPRDDAGRSKGPIRIAVAIP